MILTQAWKQFFKTKITLHSKILTDFHGFAEKINLAATGTDHQQLIHNTAFNLFALVNEENHQVSFCHHYTTLTGTNWDDTDALHVALTGLGSTATPILFDGAKAYKDITIEMPRILTNEDIATTTADLKNLKQKETGSGIFLAIPHLAQVPLPSFSTCSPDRHLTILQNYISPQNKRQSNLASPRPTW